jgi:hypothetical protein
MSILLFIAMIVILACLAGASVGILIVLGIVGFMVLVLYAYAFGWQR